MHPLPGHGAEPHNNPHIIYKGWNKLLCKGWNVFYNEKDENGRTGSYRKEERVKYTL